MKPPIGSILVSDRTWNGTVPDFDWEGYNLLTSQAVAVALAKSKYLRWKRENESNPGQRHKLLARHLGDQ